MRNADYELNKRSTRREDKIYWEIPLRIQYLRQFVIMINNLVLVEGHAHITKKR